MGDVNTTHHRTILHSRVLGTYVNAADPSISMDLRLDVRQSRGEGRIEVIMQSTGGGQYCRGELRIVDAALRVPRERTVEAMQDMLLAVNLTTHPVAFVTIYQGEEPMARAALEPRRALPKIWQDPAGTARITLQEDVGVSDSVHIQTTVGVVIDWTVVLELYGQILSARSIAGDQGHDLRAALGHFHEATRASSIVTAFQSMCQSAECAVGLKGDARRDELARLSGLATDEIQAAFEFNNALKHVNRTPKKQRSYDDGMARQSERYSVAARCAIAALRDRLPR